MKMYSINLILQVELQLITCGVMYKEGKCEDVKKDKNLNGKRIG